MANRDADGSHHHQRRETALTELTIGVQTGPTGTVLSLTGEVDVSNVAKLRRATRQALAAKPHVLTLDLARLAFCDSTGISALIAGRQEADVRHVTYRVVNVHGPVASALTVTGVLAYLNTAVEPDTATPASEGRGA